MHILTKQQIVGCRIKVRKGHPQSTVAIVVDYHPAIDHIYWQAPGFGSAGQGLENVELTDLPISDMRPKDERDRAWIVVLFNGITLVVPPTQLQGI